MKDEGRMGSYWMLGEKELRLREGETG